MTESYSRQFTLLLTEAATSMLAGAISFALVARIGGKELLAAYALIFSWVTVFQGLGNFGISELTIREVGSGRPDLGRYATHAFVLACVTSAGAVAVMNASLRLVGYPPELSTALMIASAALAPTALSAICRGFLLAAGRTGYVPVIAAVDAVTSMSLTVYLLLTGRGIGAFAVALVLSRLLTFALSARFVARHGAPLRSPLAWQYFRDLLPATLAFGLGGILGTLSTRLNLIVLSILGTMNETALFAVSSKIVELALALSIIFNQLMLPRFAATHAREGILRLAGFAPVVHAFLRGMIALALGLFLFAHPVLDLVFGSSYASATPVLRILAVFLAIESVDGILGIALKASGLPAADVRAYSVNPALNLGMSVLLIPPLGASGAAVGRLVGVLGSGFARILLVGRALGGERWGAVWLKPLCSVLPLGLVAAALAGVVPQLLAAGGYLVAAVALVLLPLRSARGPSSRA